MFGKLLGKIVAAPFRLVNIPVKLAEKGMDEMCGETGKSGKNILDDVARTVEETCEEAMDD